MQRMPDTQLRDWTRRLLAAEAAAGEASAAGESAVLRVYEKLRRSLSALAGADGFWSLAARALLLAKAKAPSLCALRVAADGAIDGLEKLEPQVGQNNGGEAGAVLIDELLGLFLDFLGSALTLRLVQDIAPHLKASTKSVAPIPVENIMQEVARLNDVSERLESLVGQNPLVESALMILAGNIRTTATLLDVLIVVKSKSAEPVNEFGAPASIN